MCVAGGGGGGIAGQLSYPINVPSDKVLINLYLHVLSKLCFSSDDHTLLFSDMYLKLVISYFFGKEFRVPK